MNLRSPITRSVDGRTILSKALNLKTSSEIKSSDRNAQALKLAYLNAEQFAKTWLSSSRSDRGAEGLQPGARKRVQLDGLGPISSEGNSPQTLAGVKRLGLDDPDASGNDCLFYRAAHEASANFSEAVSQQHAPELLARAESSFSQAFQAPRSPEVSELRLPQCSKAEEPMFLTLEERTSRLTPAPTKHPSSSLVTPLLNWTDCSSFLSANA